MMIQKIYLFVKYSLDRLIAMLLLIIISPIFLSVCIAVAISMGRPVFFRQDRGGYKNSVFSIYKLRTMTNERDASGKLLPDDKRLTLLGRLIRKFSLDELPQLINIVKGEMSFIGPRPLFSSYIPLYSDYQKRRHDLKPGITGWAQVKGRNSLTWEEKFDKDIYYVEKCSLCLDIKILFLTVYHVLAAKDINQGESITMVEFKGNETSNGSN